MRCAVGRGGGVCHTHREGGGGALQGGGCRRWESMLFKAFFDHSDTCILYRLWLIYRLYRALSCALLPGI